MDSRLRQLQARYLADPEDMQILHAYLAARTRAAGTPAPPEAVLHFINDRLVPPLLRCLGPYVARDILQNINFEFLEPSGGDFDYWSFSVSFRILADHETGPRFGHRSRLLQQSYMEAYNSLTSNYRHFLRLMINGIWCGLHDHPEPCPRCAVYGSQYLEEITENNTGWKDLVVIPNQGDTVIILNFTPTSKMWNAFLTGNS